MHQRVLLPLLLLLLPCAGKHTREQNRAATGKVTGGSAYLADGTHWDVALSLKTACQADPSACKHPRGHMQPLGHHRDSEPIATYREGDLPTPAHFWKNHVNGFQPAFFPGLAKRHPAYSEWGTDSVLAKKFGHIDVKTEPKHEERLSDHCARRSRSGGSWVDSRGIKPDWVVPCPQDVQEHVDGRTKLSDFLERYRHESIYSITQLPSLMAADVLVPPFAQCGWREPLARDPEVPWMTQMYEANLWMSFNEGEDFSKSVLHYDQNHGFMCVYSGHKQWVFIDTIKHADDVPLWENNFNRHNPAESRASDDSLIDGEYVDLLKYPAFANTTFSVVDQHAGDCLWIPAKYLHYVRSRGRNVGVSWMIQDKEIFDAAVCNPPPAEHLPLAQHDILWDFPGLKGEPEHNVIKMGFPNWARLRRQLAKKLKSRGIGQSTFMQWYVNQGGRREDAVLMFEEMAGIDSVLQDRELYSKAGSKMFRRLAIGDDDDSEEEDEL